MDAILPLLRHAARADVSKLPDELITVSKRFILDTMAVMIAGTCAPGAEEIIRYVSGWSGFPDAALATGGRAPAPYAALANGMMAHALEFDDTYEPADVHACCVVLPAVLAAAELPSARGRSGADIIAAVAIGVDIAYRLGAAINTYRGWHPTATCGIFGAVLGAGRIAGLSEAKLHHSAGIAYSLVSGNFQSVVDASLSKRLQPGFAARGAVEAVLLAQAGFTGARDILEGAFGFYPLLESGDYDRDALLQGLGSVYLGQQASMKPYPCCRFSHAAIDAALELAEELDLPPSAKGMGQIDRVEIMIPSDTYDYVGRAPGTGDNPIVEAQFSVAYAVTRALAGRAVGLNDFTPAAVREPPILAFAQAIRVVPQAMADRYGPSTIRLHLKSGRLVSREIAVRKGEPENMLGDSELRAKVASCIRYSKRPDRVTAGLVEWAERLDQTDDPLPRLHSLFSEGAGT